MAPAEATTDLAPLPADLAATLQAFADSEERTGAVACPKTLTPAERHAVHVFCEAHSLSSSSSGLKESRFVTVTDGPRFEAAHARTRCPFAAARAMTSTTVVVLPVPGGPWTRKSAGSASARATHARWWSSRWGAEDGRSSAGGGRRRRCFGRLRRLSLIHI